MVSGQGQREADSNTRRRAEGFQVRQERGYGKSTMTEAGWLLGASRAQVVVIQVGQVKTLGN